MKLPEVDWGPDKVTFTWDITDEVADLYALGVPVDVARRQIEREIQSVGEQFLTAMRVLPTEMGYGSGDRRD